MSLAGKKIVFTGTLSMKRADATTKAINAGASVVGSVSKNTDILVAGPGAGAKEATAKGLGVEVMTEDEFVAACDGKKTKKATPAKTSKKAAKEDDEEDAVPKKAAGKKAAGGGAALSGKTVVFTGTLDMKRADAKSAAEGAGAKVTGVISGKTDIVVAGAAAGDKLAIAKGLGVTIWTESEFNSALGGGKAPVAAAKPAAKKATPAKTTGKKAKEVSEDDEDEDEEEAPPKKVAKQAASNTASSSGGRVVDRCIPGRGEFKVFEDYSVTLNQTNVDGNNNKYYIIQLLVKDGTYYDFNRWGRVGEDGQKKLDSHGSFAAAQAAFEKKFKDKSSNAWASYKSGSFTGKSGKYIVIETEEKEGSGADNQPMGKLTKAQIEKGQVVLAELSRAVESNQKSQFSTLSSQFYTLIPHDFGRKVPPAITDIDTVKKKEELLKFYLRMGFEEIEEEDTGLNPIEGVMDLEIPATLEAAISNCCPLTSIKQSVHQGKKLSSEQAGGPTRKMTADQYGAIMLYTSNAIYKDLNKVLREEKRKAVEKYFKYLRLLLDSADALPQKKVQLWRGIGCALNYKEGDTITWWGVSSCTSEQKVARNFMNNCGGDCSMLTLDTKTAIDISPMSFYSSEKESLLMPGTQLKVKKVEKKTGSKCTEYRLEEVGRAC